MDKKIVLKDEEKAEEETVSDLLSHLDPHKSMGLDGIHTRMMRELAEELSKPLSIIYQQSWLTGEVPDDWKLANVTPIRKKGYKEDPGKYRLVSVTSVPGKVTEQIILGTMTGQQILVQQIRSNQHEFRKGRSCLTNLISFYDQHNRKLIKFIKGKRQILCLGYDNFMLQESLETNELEKRPGSSDGQRSEQELVMCPCGKKNPPTYSCTRKRVDQ
ncbi:hypothetical protein BTVI_43774 [Pitangus sulphuratus]|nr:hypothetical protein BTVI_43774 [Pitangus sulphuratus]